MPRTTGAKYKTKRKSKNLVTKAPKKAATTIPRTINID